MTFEKIRREREVDADALFVSNAAGLEIVVKLERDALNYLRLTPAAARDAAARLIRAAEVVEAAEENERVTNENG